MDAAVKAEVAAALEKCQKSGLVQGVNLLYACLERHSMCRFMRIEPHLIGTDPHNRDGFGISVKDCHDLIRSITEVGFCSSETAPVCAELDPFDREPLAFNERLTMEAQGYLPPCPHMRFTSLAGSHLNAGLRCIAAGCKSDIAELVHSSGRLSLDVIKDIDPLYAEAVTSGLRWRVISFEPLREFPEMKGLIQSASNASGHLAKGEHELQLLKRIGNMVSSAEKRKGPCSYKDLKDSLLRSKPVCAPAAPFMHRFIVKFSAGAPGLLDRVEKAVKQQCSSSKQLGGDFFEALCSEGKGVQDLMIDLRHASMPECVPFC